MDYRGKASPLWLNLCFQLLLDIRHTLKGNIGRGFSELEDIGAKYTSHVRQYFQYRRTIRGKNEGWHKENDSGVLKLVTLVKVIIKNDFLLEKLRAYSKRQPEDLGHKPRPFFMLKNHPLLCGMLAYWMQQTYRDFMFSFVNSYGAVLSTGHLYNALLIRNLVNQWEDMEYLFKAQGVERFFITQRPTAPEHVLKIYQLSMGISTQAFAKSRRKGGKVGRLPPSAHDIPTRVRPRWHRVHSIFARHYDSSHKEDRYDLSIDNLSSVISGILETHPDLKVAKSWQSRLVEHDGLPEPQVLELIKVALEDDDEHLRFDWLGMHARCQKFIDAVRDTYASRLEEFTDRPTNPMEVLPKPPSDLGQFVRELFEELIPWDHTSSITVPAFLLANDEAAQETALRNVITKELEPLFFGLQRMLGVSLTTAAEVLRPILDGEGSVEMKKAKDSMRTPSRKLPAPIFDSWMLLK